MKTQVHLLVVLVLLTHSVCRGQSSCPDGFRYAGTLSGNGSSVTPFDKVVFILLPKFAELDTSYQQTDVQATNGRAGVKSALHPQDIPRGILINPYGKNDEAHQVEWAVSNPQLQPIKDANGKVVRQKFGMRLACAVGHREANPNYGTECSVGVEVCYKPSQTNKN
jgi:hypothetical protein